MKILVVEDDFVSRELLQAILNPFAKIEVAKNGIEALSKYSASIETEKPYDLICLDIMMPELNGQEVLKEIRNQEEEKGITDKVKVLMITALGDAENIKNAFMGECEAYLIKPIDSHKLIKELEDLGFTV